MSNLRAVALLLLIVPSNILVSAQTAGTTALSTIPPDRSQHREAVTSGYGVEPLLTRLIPHPYVSFGPSLLGDGYAPLAWRLEGGLDMESTRLVLLVRAAYDNVHLASDGIQPGPKGHDRYLESAAYFRPSWQPLPGKASSDSGGAGISFPPPTPAKQQIVHKSEADTTSRCVPVQGVVAISRCESLWIG